MNAPKVAQRFAFNHTWWRASGWLGVALIGFLGAALTWAGELSPYDLRCDSMANPLGVDSAQPRLSWKLRSASDAQTQTAWQVRVASTREQLAQGHADLWDSGRNSGAAQLDVPYGGQRLATSQQVFWQARVWDKAGAESQWSEVQTWTMGVLQDTDWEAHWITEASFLPWVRERVGYRSESASSATAEKWIILDLGAVHPVEIVRLYPMRQVIEEAQGLPLRFVIQVARSADFSDAEILADFRKKNFSYATTKDKTTVPTFRAQGGKIHGRFVRILATQLRPAAKEYFLALSQVEIVAGGRNVAVGAKVTASDSLEQSPWAAAALTDGRDVRDANSRENATLLARREFVVKPGLRRAIIHVSGLGQYEMNLNGQRVGETVLSPGWTTYDKTVLYDTHDVTVLLAEGKNAVGVVLAGGMYNVRPGRYVKFESLFRPLKLIAQIRLEYADGKVELVGTDERWQLQWGPTTFANVYGGEDHDARQVPEGWDRAGFEPTDWRAALVTTGPGGELKGVSHAAPPLRTHEVFSPKRVHMLRSDVSIYDFGQNVSMMPRLRVSGPAGSTVKLIPGERLKEDGSVDRTGSSRGTGEAWWSYTLAGTSGGESWFPQFFYHGARYLQVEVLPAPTGESPRIEQLEGVAVYSASEGVGEFACSNDLFNRIRELVLWAQRSNTVSVFTDCPHRERLGWLEQAHLNGPALRYEYDLQQLFGKVFADMADAQTSTGLIPDIAPEYVIFSDDFRDSPEWGSAIILAAWQHYEWTGDLAPFRRHFPAMQRYLDYLRSRRVNGLLQHGLGDWYDIGPKGPGRAQLTPVGLTASAIYFADLETLAKAAALLGRRADAERLRTEAEEVRHAFRREYWKPDAGVFATGSQCANALPLAVGLVPEEERECVVEALVADVRARGLTAGDVGYRYLLRALADAGRSEEIFRLNNQSSRPGYGYQLAQGATSLTEAWNAGHKSSQNHFMLGQITEWFYHDLAGIQPDPAGPGFEKIIIRPAPVGDISWVKASHETPRGRVSVEWHRKGKEFLLDVTIPPNTSARVFLPDGSAPRVMVSGHSRFTASCPAPTVD